MFKNKYVQIVFVLMLMGIIGFFVANDFKKEDTSFISNNDNKKVIQKGDLSLTLSEDSGDVEVKQIPIADDNILNYPKLDEPLVFSNSFPEDARLIIRNNVTTLTEQLKADPTSFESWMDLANQYKIIDDYRYASDIWEFLSEVAPENSISFHNLGNTYHYNLKDFPKAEENFRKAVENDRNNTQVYVDFHELYKYSYKQDTTLAVDILLEGIVVIENDIDLLTTLAVYYKEIGNTAEAKKYYEQARDQAQKLENAQLVDLLNEEISNL